MNLAALGYGEFSQALARSVVELDLQCSEPSRFRGSLAGNAAGDVHLLSIASTSQSVTRSPSMIERSSQKYYKFTVMEHGSGVFVQDGREAVLNEGDMTIYATDLPYTLLFERDVRVSVLMFPKDMLRLPTPLMQNVTGTRISGSTGIGSVVRPFVSALAAQLEDVGGVTGRRLLRSAVGLVGELIEPLGTDPGDRYSGFRRAVVDYIEEHLSDPELDPPRVAAALYVSLRQLYCAFEGTGVHVAGLIRSRRLERCFEDLGDPRLVSTTVAAIGVSNGFPDAAHFSRLFKARYGVSPSSLRNHSA
jgi:AraC-like DNA-binding protein